MGGARTGVRPGSPVPGHPGRHRRPPRRAGRWVLLAGAVALLVLVAAVVVPRLGGGPASGPSAAPVDTGDLTAPAKRDVAMQLIASAENPTLDWRGQYGYIEWDVEGVPAENRGYTAGLVGFCSGCGDMTRVVERYAELAPGNDLQQYLPAIQRQAELGIGDVTQEGLGEPFVDDWRAAAGDRLFRQAQDDVLAAQYFDPAVAQGLEDGVSALGQFVYYDTLVMHGPGEQAGAFGGIRADALEEAAPPSRGGDETAWLHAFLDARVAAMRTEQAHQDTSRVDTAQRLFLEAGNLHLVPPLRWSVYGDPYAIG
jgi:chitosanase